MDRPHFTTPTLGLITLLALTVALFLNLGLPPLTLEEPRRALITLEMIYNGNLLVPTEFGVPYYNKPPLWNWVIAAAFRLFGGYTEFAVRFFSAASLLATGGVMYLLGRRHLDPDQATLSSLLFLVCGNLLFYFSLLGEIDLFYAFLTFSAFAALFHYYQRQAWWIAFPLFYLLHALGFLTKGLPSLAFAGITLMTLLIYRRDLRRLLSLPHLAGVLLFLAVAGGYFALYAWHHPVDGYLQRLWGEASARTLASGDRVGQLLTHLLSYPLQTLQATLPAALLAPLLFHRRFLEWIRENPLIEFYFWTGIANYALYWFSPGSKQRYVYMLYPFLTTILVWFHRRVAPGAPRRSRLFDGMVLLLPGVGAVACMALPFVVHPTALPLFIPASVTGALAALALLVLAWQRPGLRLWTLIWLAVLLRLVMDLTLIPMKAHAGTASVMRETASEIARHANGEPVYLYRGTTCSRAIVFYLERASGQVVRRADRPAPDRLFIAEASRLTTEPHQVLYRFTDQGGGDHLLVRFRSSVQP